MASKKRTALNATHAVATLAALYAAAGMARPARADDDDKKSRDKQPAIVGPVRHGADAWKALAGHTPVGSAGDDTFLSRNINLKTWLPLNNFPGYATASSPSGADCWGYVSPSGREYALMGLSWGNGIVEVSDPSSPSILTTIPGSVNSLWRDITVVGSYAYAVSDQSGVGIQVMNLADIDTGQVTLVRNFSQGGHTTTHTIVSNPQSGYLYLCGGNAAGGGMIPANTNIDPTLPTFTGPGWTVQYVHEAQIITYPPDSGPYAGHEIAFLFAAGPYYGLSRGLAIVDVTNKAAPQQLCLVAYPGLEFCHQGWVSADRKYLYVDDELDTPSNGNVPAGLTRVFDITDLANPRMVSAFTNGNGAIDHNQYTNGRYLFQSNYTSGLRIWDLSNPLKPVEVAWIDTRPENDAQSYNGSWGNYALFPSGTVLISDLERGLFIVKMSILELSLPAPAPTTVTPGQATPVSVRVAEKEAATGPVSVMVSINGGSYTAYPMTAAGGGVYNGSLPATGCNDRVGYYFLAQTNEASARSFTWPVNAAGGDVLTASSQTGQTTVFADTFETDQGWTVQGTVLSGAWVRGTPLYNGGPGAVVGDADGSGQCFVTGNTLNQEVNGGPTRLVSPAFDLSAAPEARVSFSRWFLSTVGATDQLLTELSNDNGQSWAVVDVLSTASGGWSAKSFRIADFMPTSSQVRVRFSVSDPTSDSITEAGIDAFAIITPTCTAACYANCDGSSLPPLLNVNDFLCFQNRYAANDPYANCDGSTTPPVLNVNDFICFQNRYASGCP